LRVLSGKTKKRHHRRRLPSLASSRFFLKQFQKNQEKPPKMTQVSPQSLPKRNWCRDRHGQFAAYAFTIGNRSMRLWTGSSGVGVLMIAFLIATRSAMAQTPAAGENIRLIGPAKSTGFSPIGAATSSADQAISTVALPMHNSIGFPRNSAFHPKAPNIHTRPKKKNTSWWPFGKK
jgi:hypothetical protein